MKSFRIKSFYKKLLADINTPVSIYLRLRDKFPNSILLESSDYHGNENSFSFICCQPMASIRVEKGKLIETYPDNSRKDWDVSAVSVPSRIDEFIRRFEPIKEHNFNFINNGLFGYTTYDAVEYFENIKLDQPAQESKSIPAIYYSMYRFVIAINHFKNEMYLFDHQCFDCAVEELKPELDMLEYLIRSKDFPVYKFSSLGEEKSNFSDTEFLENLEKVKGHNQRGDIFQMVLSRSFSKEFMGDEFNVYRALRSINPSPYLFYFDYGSFKIFGSSPEAQIVIRNGTATIHPIAGTFKRSGNDKDDQKLAEMLRQDPKENSEHVMLVDLARNDLSRNCEEVEVERFREIQFYSHVIHLVSKVSGNISDGRNTMRIVADTFPAGTLSGAPKYKAMQLIDKYERGRRGFYGGCIGVIGFNGYFNHAIMIRSFLSKNNVLHYQAGAGIVADSQIENELNEVNSKLLALKTAIVMAEELV